MADWLIPDDDEGSTAASPTWGDYAKSAAAGAMDLGAQAAAGVRYLNEDENAPQQSRLAEGAKALEYLMHDFAQSTRDSMSEGGRARAEATWIPERGKPSAWDAPFQTMLMQGAGMAPMVAISALPGGVLGRVLGTAGRVGGTAAAGAGLQVGQLVDEVMSSTDNLSDEELQKESPLYKEFRGKLDEDQARAALHKVQLDGKLLTTAAVGAVINSVGPGGKLAEVGAEGAKAVERGLLKETLAGAGSGALAQGAGAAQLGEASQQANVDIGTQGEVNYHDVLLRGLEGGAVGGILGGAVHGASAAVGKVKGKRAPTVTETPDEITPVAAEADALTNAPVDTEVALQEALGTERTKTPEIDTQQRVDEGVETKNDDGSNISVPPKTSGTTGALPPPPGARRPKKDYRKGAVQEDAAPTVEVLKDEVAPTEELAAALGKEEPPLEDTVEEPVQETPPAPVQEPTPEEPVQEQPLVASGQPSVEVTPPAEEPPPHVEASPPEPVPEPQPREPRILPNLTQAEPEFLIPEDEGPKREVTPAMSNRGQEAKSTSFIKRAKKAVAELGEAAPDYYKTGAELARPGKKRTPEDEVRLNEARTAEIAERRAKGIGEKDRKAKERIKERAETLKAAERPEEVSPEKRSQYVEEKVRSVADEQTPHPLESRGGATEATKSKVFKDRIRSIKEALDEAKVKPEEHPYAAAVHELVKKEEITPQDRKDFNTLAENTTKGKGGDLELAALIADQNREARHFKDEEPYSEKTKGGLVHSTDVKSLLSGVDFTGLHGLPRKIIPFVRDKLVNTVGDISVHFVSTEEMERTQGKGTRGYYHAGRNHIVVDSGIVSDPHKLMHVLMHEGVHAQIQKSLDSDRAFKVKIAGIAREAMHYLSITNPKLLRHYGFTNVHEFMSEALTNREFQSELAKIPVSRDLARQFDLASPRRSLWDLVIYNVRKLLNLPRDSHRVIEAVIRAYEDTDQIVPKSAQELYKYQRGSAISEMRDLSNRDKISAAVEAHKSWWVRNVITKGMTLDNIRQTYRGLFKGKDGGDLIERVVSAMQKVQPYATKLRDQGHQISARFIEYKNKNRAEAEKLADILTRATIHDVQLEGPNTHLKNGVKDYQVKRIAVGLKKEFASISEEGKKLYREMRDYYKKTQTDMRDGLIENYLDDAEELTPAQKADLKARTLAGTLDGLGEDFKKEHANLIKSLKDATELANIKGDYFPLMRHGEHVVLTEAHHGDLKGGKIVDETNDGIVVEKIFNNKKDAEAWAKELSDTQNNRTLNAQRTLYDGTTKLKAADEASANKFGYKITLQTKGVHFFDTATQAEMFRKREADEHAKISKRMDREEAGARADLTHGQFASMLAAVERRYSDNPAMKKLMKGMLEDASVRLMAGNRVQQRSLARRGVKGASDDLARNMVTYAEASSRYLAKIKYGPEVREGMRAIHEENRANRYSGDEETKQRVVNALDERISNGFLPSETPQFLHDLLQISYLSRLFSPMFSVVNSTQPWMVTMPVLAGEHGTAKAIGHLGRAYDDIGGWGRVGEGITNTVQAAKDWKKAVLDTQHPMQSVRDRLSKLPDGKNLTDMFDMLVERGAIDQSAGMEIAGAVSSGRGTVGTAIAKVDRIARQATEAIEAINRSVTALAAYRLAREKGLTHDAAKNYALDKTLTTQGDYRTDLSAPVFKRKYLGPALQFKKYAQMMGYVIGDMADRAFHGATHEERMAGYKQLGILMATTGLAAGAMGLPGVELLRMGGIIGSAMGLTGTWQDAEDKFYKALEGSVGKTPANVILHGLPRIHDWLPDLGSRVGLDSMLTFGEPKSTDSDGLAAYVGDFLLGSPGSMVIDWITGVKDASQGDYAKGLSKMLPVKFMADTAKAARGYHEGKTDLPQALVRALGARTSGETAESERIGRIVRVQKAQQEEGKALSKELNDPDISPADKAKAISKIKEYNKRATAKNRISTKTWKELDVDRADREFNAKRGSVQ